MKRCIMEKMITMESGRTVCRCQFDGSIRNECKGPWCPHFRPTWRWKVFRWIRKEEQ